MSANDNLIICSAYISVDVQSKVQTLAMMDYIDLIGTCLGKGSIMIDMETKYGFKFSFETVEKNITRLTNQMWKLIPMRENGENWEKQLNTVILEIAGLNEVFVENPQFL